MCEIARVLDIADSTGTSRRESGDLVCDVRASGIEHVDRQSMMLSIGPRTCQAVLGSASSPEDEFSQENGEDTECRQLLNRLDHVPVRHASGAGYEPRSREALELVTEDFLVVKLVRAFGGCLGTKRR